MPLSNADDWRTIASVLALGVSLTSIWLTRKNWLQSNRPIVSAVVETHAGGSESIAYNLAVSNTGNRPAANVRLRAERSHIDACVSEWVRNFKGPHTTFEGVIRCFTDEGEIPLLLNGKTMINSFGYTRGDDQTFWRYGSSLPVQIEYSDLEGRKYQSTQILRIKDSAAFAGGMWADA